MVRFPAFVAPLLVITLAGTPAQADEAAPSPIPTIASPSPSTESDEPSPNPSASPSPSPKPASPKPSESASPAPASKSATSRSVGPSPATTAQFPTASASPAGLTGQELAALALIDRLDLLVPGVRIEGGTPMKRLQAAVEAVRSRLVEIERRLEKWIVEERASATRLAAAEAKVLEARSAVADAAEALREQAGDFYMAPSWSDRIVFAAGNIEDAGRAKGYMTALLGDRIDVVEMLRAAQVRFERERDALAAASSALTRAGTRIRQERAVLTALQAKMRGLLDEVVRSYGNGSAEFARLIAAAQRGQTAAPMLERYVLAPLEGPVTSPFGPRTHPIYGYRSLHTGTDIAAPAGTPLLAPRDGIIVAAGDAGPFGTSVVIDHGGRIATVLSHLSAALVEPGDVVSVGDVVGLVGCTGWCTGPHLHFEVWFEGAAQNPVAWMIERPADGPLMPVVKRSAPAPNQPAEETGTLTGLKNPFADPSARP